MVDVRTACYNLGLSSNVSAEIQRLREDFTTSQWTEDVKTAAITFYSAAKFNFSVHLSEVANEFNTELYAVRSCLDEVISEYELSHADFVQQLVQFSSANKHTYSLSS